MTFKEIYEEAAARGFSDMLTEPAQLVRLKRFVNSAYQEVNDWADWPYLEASKEGLSGMVIADLQHVQDVTDLAHDEQLDPADRRELVSLDPNLSGTGNAERWFIEGEGTFKVYPLDAVSKFLVRYMKVPAELVADADEPIVPKKYQELISEGTVIRCYRNRDNYEAAGLVRSEWKLGISNMEKALLKRNRDKAKKILRSGRPSDYLN